MTNEDSKSKPKLVQLELFSELNADSNDAISNSKSESADEIQTNQTTPDTGEDLFDHVEPPEENDQTDKPETADADESEATDNDNIVISLPSAEGLSIGDQLKNARLSQNRTIDDVAQTTRIRNDFIERIEENDFSKLPTAAIFTKSFIKSLCREYNLDSDHIISEFDKEVIKENSADIKSPEDHSAQTKNFRRDDTDAALLRKQTSLKFAWIITLLIFCIAVITLIYVVRSRKSVNTPDILQLNANSEFISEDVLEQFMMPEQLEFEELDIPVDNNNEIKHKTIENKP